MNLTIKSHGIWKINNVNTPILNWPSLTMLFHFIFFSFWRLDLNVAKYTPRFTTECPPELRRVPTLFENIDLGCHFELLFTRQVTSIAIYVKGVFVRSGIRTHAYKSRLRPERSALDRSAILTSVTSFDLSYLLILQGGRGGRREGGWVVKPSKALWVGTRFMTMFHSSWNEVNLLNQLTTRTPTTSSIVCVTVPSLISGTLVNSNSPLTRSKTDFPWICLIYLL